MAIGPSLSHRSVALLSLAVGLLLLTAPLWIGLFDLQQRISTYERVEVTTSDGVIHYAESPPGRYPPISEDLGCTHGHTIGPDRLCAHEAALASSGDPPIVDWTDDPDIDGWSPPSRYWYLRVNDGIYEPTAIVGPEQENPPPGATGRYPIYLDVEQVDPDEALQRLAVSVTAEEVPDVVRDAAREGAATTRGTVDAPDQPTHASDGTHYRVVLASSERPPYWQRFLHLFATWAAPVLGLLSIYAASRRIRVSVSYRQPL